jgi:uncharacterized protein (DUF885 family)
MRNSGEPEYSVMNPTHTQLAIRYFNYLARRFPVMCASDEFHFLPRAEDAADHYDRLEIIEAERMNECFTELKQFRKTFSQMAEEEKDLENRIDLELLKANISGILIELEKNQTWRHNPLLYLKIAFIGIDHALNKPAAEKQERFDRVLRRLSSIPRLLIQARANIDQVPDTYHHAALEMVNDGRLYLDQLAENFHEQHSHGLLEGIEHAISSIKNFGKYLGSISPVPDKMFSQTSLENSLKNHFLSVRSLKEVYQIAVDEWHENLRRLKELQSKINPAKSWQELYHGFCPDIQTEDIFLLYRLETEQLQSFFIRHGFKEEDIAFPLEITATPTYLRSVRSAASFAAAFSSDSREKSYFFITTHFSGRQHPSEADDLLRKRLHREYKFLTAHETVPGHHLLDSIRRRLKNPVRRQIESPLFYEGWAYYAESLLTEKGYVQHPMEYLVDYKRRLWRSARCRIDVGLPAGFLCIEDAIGLLKTAGFSREEAQRQIDRFQLNPGYQLCYSLGRYEIIRLKETFGAQVGNETFHSFLLEGGELPFQWIEKRLQKMLEEDTGKPSRVKKRS